MSLEAVEFPLGERVPVARPVAAEPSRGSARWLRAALLALDTGAATAGWLLAFLAWPATTPLRDRPLTTGFVIAGAVVVTIVVIACERLYLARVAGVRAIEVARLARGTLVAAVIVFFGTRVVEPPLSGWRVALGGFATFFFLAFERSAYSAWLKNVRMKGRYTRPVVIVGSNEEGHDLYRLITTHPEIGYTVTGVVGSPEELATWNSDVPWLGDLEHSRQAVAATGANGVFVASTALAPAQLNQLARGWMHDGVHVHLSSGLRRVSQKRLRSLPLAYEPLFYLEAASLSPWQLRAKRLIDVLVSSLVLVLTAPLLLLAALAIKLADRGPVFFRQQRIGRNGQPFTLLKLRTMVPDAEARLADVRKAAGNQRVGGPLFKLATDPRRTRIGRVLERTSIDELPQLINVLRGEMSLVGPRPALPAEVVLFDDELNARHSVRPGITGLWQVEARDNPSFGAYRRLDLFYVENWSVALDTAILLATAKALLLRIVFKR